jgi:hypothetical protein
MARYREAYVLRYRAFNYELRRVFVTRVDDPRVRVRVVFVTCVDDPQECDQLGRVNNNSSSFLWLAVRFVVGY